VTETSRTAGDRRIGVYLCHCGGNISDYVDVDRVRDAVKDEPGVVVVKTAMFTCSDATQQEIVQDIRDHKLDGLVVASCSPKLHQFTFREVARRGELNPYEYTQVNIREQCSWAHTDDRAGATEKAIRLVRAGIAKTSLSLPLTPMVVTTVPRVLVVGAGIAGLRASVGLADIGLEVILVEREAKAGGWVAGFGEMYPHGRNGGQLVARMLGEVAKRPRITLFTGAELLEKTGSFGNFRVRMRLNAPPPGTAPAPSAGTAPAPSAGTLEADVGAVIVATGFDSYQPRPGESGYGLDGVVTLPEFERLLTAGAGGTGGIVYRGKPVKTIAYVYCVGSRQSREPAGSESGGANRYCSRYCCNAAGHASVLVAARDSEARQYHLYRDIRTYGKFEAIYSRSRETGSVYVEFDPEQPPVVTAGTRGGLEVTVGDLLTAGEELTIPADLVVLVTGMAPRRNEDLARVLKLPLGRDRFYNEIHPKLRPVETLIDGVFIAGAAQGPKTLAESVTSALAAVSKGAALLLKGYVDLPPTVATVDTTRCTWCGECAAACPYEGAVIKVMDGERYVAEIQPALCKGCGGCVPVCGPQAIDLAAFTNAQVTAMIDALAVGAA